MIYLSKVGPSCMSTSPRAASMSSSISRNFSRSKFLMHHMDMCWRKPVLNHISRSLNWRDPIFPSKPCLKNQWGKPEKNHTVTYIVYYIHIHILLYVLNKHIDCGKAPWFACKVFQSSGQKSLQLQLRLFHMGEIIGSSMSIYIYIMYWYDG